MSKQFPGMVQQVLKSNKLDFKYGDFLKFWRNEADNGENTILYINEIIRQIIQIEGNKRSTKAGAISELLCTLLSLYAFKMDSADKKIVSLPDLERDWKIHEEKLTKQGIAKCPFVFPILSTFFLYYVNNEARSDNLQAMIFSNLCMLPQNITSPLKKEHKNEYNSKYLYELQKKSLKDTYSKLKEYYYKFEVYQKSEHLEYDTFYHALYNEDCELYETGELSFGYEYIYSQLKEQKRTAEGGIAEILLELSLQYLELLPCILDKFPYKAEKTGIILLHMLKQMITSNPLTFEKAESQLRRMVQLIEVLKHWPYPIGFLAVEMIDLLNAEVKTPGTAFRFRLREEMPAIDLLNIERKRDDKCSALQIAYCILDKKRVFDQNSFKLEFKLNKQAQEKFAENFMTVHEWRLFLVVHVFHINTLATPDLIKYLTVLPEKDLFLIYSRILNILDKSNDLDSIVDVKQIQRNALEELKNEIMELETKYKLEASSFIDDKLNESQERIEGLLNTFKSFLPPFPNYYLKIINKNAIERSKGSFHNKTIATENNVNDDRKSSYLTEYSEIIAFVAKNLTSNNLPLHQEALKLILFGDDPEISTFVNQVAELLITGQFKNVDFRIYLIPNRRNSLAKLIAIKDFWYNKTIYIPFAEQPLLPRLDIINENAIEDEDARIFPFELKESLIQTYLREALRIFNVKLSEVHCYKELNVKNSTPDKIIYFCEYLEIGANVALGEMTKKKKNAAENYYEAKEKGLVKFDFIELEINAIETGIEGIFEKGDQEDQVDQGFYKANIHTLKINNIYNDYFEGTFPFPNSDWLELSYIDYENSKAKDKYLRKKTFFKKYQRQQIQNAFNSLHVNIPISEISIRQPKNQPFKILVDGKIYGNYSEIYVRVARGEDDSMLTLPIATFLPVTF